jgi:D-alanyl-lipoteichoic acid acyltransferase DltB (MBOAT superfamily)
MEFISAEFSVFFALFFALYWFVFKRNLRIQNILILTGSYVFYLWWDWRFLFLLIGSSLFNYYLGIYIDKSESDKRRGRLVFLGLLQGLGLLMIFKYFNFFTSSLEDALAAFDISLSIPVLSLLLPLGISFYTFRTVSYILDVNNETIAPTTDLVVFCSYVSFFPSLVAGPIDRAGLLIPQLQKTRTFQYGQATQGMRQILWGMFKKIVIADNCGIYVNEIFSGYEELGGMTLVLGAFYFIFQIYCDFSGYSDMAIGFARLLGFNITKNFDFPFFAQNIAEFWQKWHISLTSWLTDYVYTPLSFIFRGYGKWGIILAVIINFVLVGLWHGANWTFIVFGFLHGLFFIPLILRGTMVVRHQIEEHRSLPTFKQFLNISGTFLIVMFTSIIFRADSIGEAIDYMSQLIMNLQYIDLEFVNMLLLLVPLIIMEWRARLGQDILESSNHVIRRVAYLILMLLIFDSFYTTDTAQFIYVRF